jgi:hypothetical protein
MLGLFSTTLLIISCAHTKEPLVTKVDTVNVPVTVVQKCVTKDQIPEIPKPVIQPGGNVERLAAGASADVRQLSDYAKKADAILRQCEKE